MKILRSNAKPFALTTSFFSALSLGYIYNVATNNARELKNKQDNEVDFKDTTRPQNQYFGLSYGYRADQIVLDKLDSGDIVFIKYNCMNCISVSDILKCNYQAFTKPYPHYDSIGVIFRDNVNVKVLYDRFGTLVIEDYATFLQNPYWEELTIRQLHGSVQAHQNLKSVFHSDKIQINQSDLLKFVIENVNLLKPKFTKEIGKFGIEDLDTEESIYFNEGTRLGHRINVRTKSNNDLN